jgi:hypothetical protein
MPKPINSSVVIAKMLDSEGFSDHVANQVERYWMRNICNPRARKKYRKLDADIAAMCSKLTDGEKYILGKFIALHKRMSFDTGLRIGLSAFATKTNKEYQLVALEDDNAYRRTVSTLHGAAVKAPEALVEPLAQADGDSDVQPI